MMKRFVAILISCLAFLTGSGDVLYWQVDDTAKVFNGENDTIGTSIIGFIGDRECGARAVVTGGDLAQPYYLSTYSKDNGTLDGELGVDFGESGGYWGSGVPTGNQSSIEQLEPSEMYMEYAFMVEIGEYTWDDVMNDWNFNVLAQSDKFAANQLSQYIHERFDLNPSSLAIWTPTEFYVVPEPSTSLLCIIGLGVLMLKRKAHG